MSITIYINETPCRHTECGTEMVVETLDEAKAMLWALAKQAKPEWGMFWLPMGREPFTTEGMRLGTVPESLADRVSAKVDKENRKVMEAIICDALNTEYDELAKTFGDVPNFVEMLAEAAESWAKDCYQP